MTGGRAFSGMATAGLPSPLKAEVDPVSGRIMETPELRAEGLKQLREAIAVARTEGIKVPPTAPFFLAKAPLPLAPLVREDDAFLLPFLRSRKYEVRRALMCLNSFCVFWRDNARLIDGLCVAKIRRVYEVRAV